MRSVRKRLAGMRKRLDNMREGLDKLEKRVGWEIRMDPNTTGKRVHL